MGGSIPSVLTQCQLLNPDIDGDGIRDVHLGGYLYYSATFVNPAEAPVDYGAEHIFYATQSCPEPIDPIVSVGPTCEGTLDVNGTATRYYRVQIPDNNELVLLNPFCVEVAGWLCVEGNPVGETDRCCFDVTLLPSWEPPPVTEPPLEFELDEIKTLTVLH
ncbi:MAG: hypothetical protein ACE5OP_09965 [Candidatus Glassbacteria bacterium]